MARRPHPAQATDRCTRRVRRAGRGGGRRHAQPGGPRRSRSGVLRLVGRGLGAQPLPRARDGRSDAPHTAPAAPVGADRRASNRTLARRRADRGVAGRDAGPRRRDLPLPARRRGDIRVRLHVVAQTAHAVQHRPRRRGRQLRGTRRLADGRDDARPRPAPIRSSALPLDAEPLLEPRDRLRGRLPRRRDPDAARRRRGPAHRLGRPCEHDRARRDVTRARAAAGRRVRRRCRTRGRRIPQRHLRAAQAR